MSSSSPDADFATGLALLLRNELDASDELFSCSLAKALPLLVQQKGGGGDANGSLADRRAAALAAFGTGLVAVVRALMTFGVPEIDMATEKLNHTQKLATVSTSWLPTFSSPSQTQIQETIDLELIAADAGLFLAALQFMSENTMGYIRGGIMIRRSFKMYGKAIKAFSGTDLESPLPKKVRHNDQRCSTSMQVTVHGNDLYYDAFDEHDHALLDAHGGGELIDLHVCASVQERVRGSAQLGIGLFHLIFSLIPPRFHYVIKTTMGFDSAFKDDADRSKGLRLLRACLDGGSTRAPVAALTLLVFHSAMLIVARGISDDADTDEAMHVLDVCLRQHHDSPLFRFFEGRLYRGKCHLRDAVVSFHAAELRSGLMLPLRQLCIYEKAWCEALLGKHVEAAELFAVLAKHSPWSPAFYGYLAACCYFEHGARLMMLMSQDTRELLSSLGEGIATRAGRSIMKAITLFRAVPSAVHPHGSKQRLIPPEAYASAKSLVINAVADKVLGKAAAVTSSSLAITKRQLEDLIVGCFCPFVEIAYFWNGLFQIDQQTRIREVANLDIMANHHRMSGSLSFEPTYLLLKSALLRECRYWQDAQAVLDKLDAKPVNEYMEQDQWVVEYAKFERGLILFGLGDTRKAVDKWNDIRDSSHPFDPRFKFKVRTAIKTAGNAMGR